MIQYGGIDLASPDDSIIDLIEKTMTLSDVCPFLPANWSTDAEDAWSLTSVPHHKNLRLNCLYWPTGASRWAFANFVVDSKTLAQLRVKAFPKDLSGQHRALTLKMGGDESGFEISTSMYMLPAYPVVESDGNSLYVITLVDERYFWWEKFTTIGVTGGTTTWATLISGIASALGITIAADSISADYLKPSEDFSSRYEYLPILLDSVLDSVGHRLVRHTNGTYTTESATTAKTNDDVQLKKWERQSGGLFNFEQSKVADFPGLLPKEVTVVFPRRNDGKYLSTEYVVTTTLASLGLTQFDPGLTGRNTKKLFRSTALATSTGGGSPSNSAELATLATRITTDYYLWQLGRQHQRYANIVPYSPTGMVDHVEWTLKAERKDTTVRRWQRNVSEQTLYHRGTGGSASKCCGNIYINDSDIYFGGDSSYSFNGNLIIDNDITNITTDTINITTTDYNLTGDSITIGGNTTVLIDIGTDSTTTLTTTIGGDTVTLGGDVITIGEETTTTIDIGTDSTVTLTTTIVGDTINIGTDSTTTTTVNIGFVNITGGNVYFYNANVYNNLTIIGTFVVTGDCTIGGAGDTITIIGDTKYGDTTTTTTAPPGRLELPFMTVTGPPTYTGTTGEAITDGDNIYVYDGGWNTVGGGGSGGNSKWVLFTIDESDFTAAAMTETVDVATLGQNVYIDEIVYYVSETWVAGGSELNPAMTLRLTDGTSTFNSESIPLDANTRSVCNDIPQRTLLAYGANTVFKAIVTDSAVNVSAFTTGTVLVWIKFTALAKP